MGNLPDRENKIRDNGEDSSFDDLGSRLKRARGFRPDKSYMQDPQSGLGAALRLAAEMISTLIVGGTIGWFLDWWLDTKPWFLLVFLLFGAIAGMLNAYRAAMRMSVKHEASSTRDKTRAIEKSK